MMIRTLKSLLNKIVLSFIDFDAFLLKYTNLKQAAFLKHCEVGPGSCFHLEAGINNMQKIKGKIRVGSSTHIRGHLQVFTQGGEIQIGDNCYVGENSKIWSASEIVIGNRVLIAHNVNIHDNISHPLGKESRHKDYLRILGLTKEDANQFDLRSAPIRIGDDVWIGFNATILKGVTIGNGSIIGACSLVKENVPENVIVGGNPAKIIKTITE